MKPVDQDQPHNCWEACIASIAERPLSDLSEVTRLRYAYNAGAAEGRHDFSLREAYDEALAQLGIAIARTPNFHATRIPAGYAIANGKGPRGRDHSCVALDGEIVHDPHASRAGLTEIYEFETVVWIIGTLPRAKRS